ncbi:protein-glutamate O-methyltransferase CheR [Myxococcota bacterium]|nr:protein-glutamate O-methyltransferase CheR [Myxococcota bacterium]MBU1431263.1 protein-glutamate O-methyltransferase CheR [Myxococcota bacterium]MBU1898048.1 protein-glutamate O-methyltransferase CheR [Myxococcota bacterium]
MSLAPPNNSVTKMEFDFIRQFILERSGIALDANRMYLVESRLGPLARRRQLNGISEVVARLRAQRSGDLALAVVEAMTTNETSFFRDVHPFESLRTTLFPEIIQQKGRVDLWCAACSTGQEPYSIAMVASESFPQLLSQKKLKILATDLSTEVLEKARSGRYSQLEVNRGLPAQLLVKYFKRQGRDWHISDRLKDAIEFQQTNLLTVRVAQKMDIIFLRNVLIYFKEDNKRRVLTNIRQALRPGGYLFLGGAETILGLDAAFETVRIGRTLCYRLK